MEKPIRNSQFHRHFIGISLGDVTGVGPEVTLKAIAAEAAADDTRYLLLGDPDCARRLNAALGLNLPLKDFSRYDDPGKFFITNPQAGSLPEKLPAGSPLIAHAAVAALREAGQRCLRGELDAMVTAPVTVPPA